MSAMSKKVKFGVVLPVMSRSFEHSLRVALLSEKLGFDSILTPDHYIPTERSYKLFGIETTFDILQAWPLLAALAAETKNVKLGTCVSPIPAYNPAVLAKISATVDIISRGRLIFGAGAGYHEFEFRAYDFPWERFKERMLRTREGVEIIRKLWTEEKVTYNGKYYNVNGAIGNPKPIQKPHPPIWFGGESRRTMKLVAEMGDGWLPAALSPPELEEKIAQLERFCQENGRSLGEIEIACFPVTNVSDDAREARELSKALIKAGEEQGDIDVDLRLKWGIHGSPEMAVEQIESFIEAGANHFVFHIVPQRNTEECMKKLSEEVIGELK